MLGTTIALTTAPARAETAPREPQRDEVVLRDGTRVRGRVVQKDPGRWVVIETEDGRRHTFAWEVLAEVDLAAAADVRISDALRRAWRTRGGGGITYELRAELTGIVLPRESFGLTGLCATGTGMAPAKIYGQTAEDRARAIGGGVGGRVGYMYLSHLDPEGSSTWWSLRLGAGLDLQLLYTRTPVGIRDVNGELCSQVAKRSHEVESTYASSLLAQIPLSFGAHLGLGKFDGVTAWRGVVLGAAWAPSFVQIWGGAGGSHFQPLGVELTVDFTTLHSIPKRRRPESQLRLSLSVAPPVGDDQALVGTLGVGAAWY